jgi:hypothetical protein
MLPLSGDAARDWLTKTERARRTTPLHAEAARSGDFGFTYGKYDAATNDESGHYVRVWTRTRAGEWRLGVEVTAAKR